MHANAVKAGRLLGGLAIVTALIGACAPSQIAPAPGAPFEPQLLRLSGRWDESTAKGPRAANAGSAIFARLRGTSLVMTLDETPRLGLDWFSVRVDGVERMLFQALPGVHEVRVASGLSPGIHDIEVRKRTEAFVGAVAVRSIRADGGTLLRPPPAGPRRLEFVGDSNTVGYGNEGAGPNCTFSPNTENHDASFAALAARALDAEWSTVAFSGRGITRNYDGTRVGTVPALYDVVDPAGPDTPWTFARFHPDAIIVTMGQNDYVAGRSPPEDADITRAISTFVAHLRTVHPNAMILLVVPPGTHDDHPEGQRARTRLRSALGTVAGADVGDTRVRIFEPREASRTELTGCDFHLSVAAHARIASELTSYLARELGW